MFSKVKVFAMVALLAATTLMFSSCSKESQITGKWRITRVSSSEWSAVSDDKGEVWNFKEGGKGSVILTGNDFDASWTISGDNLNLELDGVYYSGEKVKCTGDFSIETLKSKEMSLSGSWVFKYQGEQLAKYKVNYEFEKW